MNPDLLKALQGAGLSPDSAQAIAQAAPSMSDADLWERLNGAGVDPDIATGLVHTRNASLPGGASLNDADLWETLHKKGVSDDNATAIVNARHGINTPDASDAPDTSINFRNIQNSMREGATLGYGSRMGFVDPDQLKQFGDKHQIIDMAARAIGALPLPFVATAAAPELLGGTGGAMLLGAGEGAAQGASKATNVTDAVKGAAKGAALGTAGTIAGMGVGHILGAAGTALMRKIAPEWMAQRTAGQLASEVMTPAEAQAGDANLAAANAAAPGGASPATTIPDVENDMPRAVQLPLLKSMRGVGASADAAEASTAALKSQKTALMQARTTIGNQINALDRSVPVTPSAGDAIDAANTILGRDPLPDNASSVNISDMRSLATDLKAKMRALAKQGVDANGNSVYTTKRVLGDLQDEIYAAEPRLQPLDEKYGVVSDQLRNLKPVRTAVANSRTTNATNRGFGQVSTSVGGQLTRDPMAIASAVVDRVFGNKAAMADAAAKYFTDPTQTMSGLLDMAPPPTGPVAAAGRRAAEIGLPNSLQGLFFGSR